MESKARILGHSAHQLLIVFPLGLLSTAVIFDMIYLVSGARTVALVGYWMMASGVVGGLVAAPFGWVDWFAIPKGTRAKSIGLVHGLTNVVVMGLFAGSWLLRPEGGEPVGTLALLLSFGGAAGALLGGWLGGELVSRLGVGVYDGAHVNSPNSLSGRPAHENANHNPHVPEVR